jgi:hypothetical protein
MYKPQCDSDVPTSVSSAEHMQCTRRGVPQNVFIANRYTLSKNTENLSFWRSIHNFTQGNYHTPTANYCVLTTSTNIKKNLIHNKLFVCRGFELSPPVNLYMNVMFPETDLQAIPLAHWHPGPWFNRIPSTPGHKIQYMVKKWYEIQYSVEWMPIIWTVNYPNHSLYNTVTRYFPMTA